MLRAVSYTHLDVYKRQHRDTAFNFASVISRLVAKHGLPANHSPIMRAHQEYDAIFEDIRARLHAEPGELSLIHI